MSGNTKIPENHPIRTWIYNYIGEWLALVDTVIALLTLNFYCPGIESKYYDLLYKLSIK